MGKKLAAKKKAELKALEAKVAAAKAKLKAHKTHKTVKLASKPKPKKAVHPKDFMQKMKAANEKKQQAFQSKMAKWNKEDDSDDPLASKSDAVASPADEQILLAVQNQIEGQLESASKSAALDSGARTKLRSIGNLRKTLQKTLRQYAAAKTSLGSSHTHVLDAARTNKLLQHLSADSANEALTTAKPRPHRLDLVARKHSASIVLALKSARKQATELKLKSAFKSDWKKYYRLQQAAAAGRKLRAKVVKTQLAAVESQLAANPQKSKAAPVPQWKKVLDEQLGSVAKDTREVKEVKANVMHAVGGVKHDHNSWDHYFAT